MTGLQCISLCDGSRVGLPERPVLCLGNFDGVHLAHRELIRRALELRDDRFPGSPAAAFLFREPSTDFLFPDPPAHLCTLEQKLRKLGDAGLDYAILADFPAVRELPAPDFVSEILTDSCRCAAVVCGFNYRFGKGGIGTPELLRSDFDGDVVVCEAVLSGKEPVSSTRIRNLLREGRVEEAGALLTAPYELIAPVLHGKTLGRKFGYPTVNQSFPEKQLIPAHGVYATVCRFDGRILRGVTNVGSHPTVDREAAVNCETYLPDFSGDLYGTELSVSFLYRIRPEIRFSSTEELIDRIGLDVRTAKELLPDL